MPRISRILISSLLLTLLGGSAAQAGVAWTVTSSAGPAGLVEIGEAFTLDITVRSDGEQLFALGGSVYGPDVSNFELVDGTTSSAAFVQFATGPGQGFAGLDNVQSVALDPAGGDAGIQFFNGLSISGTPATGAFDISPVTGVVGGPQFQVALRLNTPGSFTLNIGANHPTDGAIGSAGASLLSADAVVQITVVPEPGTAMLLGLGLALAAGTRPRRAHA